MTKSETRTVRSFCRVCTAVCGILVDVAGDEVVRVRGDRSHPLSRGYTCAKGRALPRMHHHPRRLERPLMRIGDELQPTPWEACLDDVGARLRRIVDDHGPQAVAVFFGSGVGMDAAGYRMAERLHAAIGTPARMSPLTIDGTAKVLVSDLVGGSAGLSPHVDRERAKLVVYVGVNPVVSHGHSSGTPDPVSEIRALRARGEVWVIDPRRTETARRATHHVAPRPGTDWAILAFLIRERLRDPVDGEALDRRTVGKDALAAAVEPFTCQSAARIADVAEADLTRLRERVRRAGRLAVVTGTGVTMSAGANVTQWLAWALMIVTDSMNRPGGVWFHPGCSRRFETFQLPISPPEGGLFGPGPRTRPASRSFLREWPCAALADEIRVGHIRAVLNLGGHLVTAFPDTNSLVPALRSLDVLATIDIIANETTALSTHVLPTKDQLERADVTLWDSLIPRVAAQHTAAVIEPVGERRSTWWVLAELGRRLGHELADTSGGVADDAMLAKITAGGRCGFDELVAAGFVEKPIELPARWVEEHVARLGGWRLAPPPLVDQLSALNGPAPLVLVPRRQPRHLNSQLADLGEVADVIVHPDDARAAGIVDGQPVVVATAQGEIVGVTKVDSGVRAGTISVPHGHEGANVNRLTSERDIDPLTGMAHYSGIAVSLRAAATRR